MPRVKRSAVYNLRNVIHETEHKIPMKDRSQIAEWERDLVATACVAIWEFDVKRLLSCLRRLTSSPERSEAWKSVLQLAEGVFNPNATIPTT